MINDKVRYIQYMGMTLKGSNTSYIFYQIFPFYPLALLYAGLDRVVRITAYEEKHLYSQKNKTSLLL